ncbi:MAG: hypothetical protein L6Q40_09985 [Azonexus sp.]|nr:hypothetical protein [Azonexus sp.]
MKKSILALLTVGLCWPLLAPAATPAPIARVVAASEQFEIVGQLDEKGLQLWVDRSADRFREAEGDYLIDDVAWLQALRGEGGQALSFTLLSGGESDLLAGELQPSPQASATEPQASQVSGLSALVPGIVAGLLLGGVFGVLWARQQRQRREGKA